MNLLKYPTTTDFCSFACMKLGTDSPKILIFSAFFLLLQVDVYMKQINYNPTFSTCRIISKFPFRASTIKEIPIQLQRSKKISGKYVNV